MIFLVVLTSAAFGWFIVGSEMARLQGQLEDYGKLVVQSFSLAIEEAIDLSAPSHLQHLAEVMVEHEDIIQCSFLGLRGERLAHAVKGQGAPISSFHHFINQPLRSKGGQVMGTLQIGLSLAKLEQQIRRLKRDILFLAMGVIGVGIILTIIFTRVLLLPIGKLVTATERVGMGELAMTVDVDSKDEIGDLAKAFNHMTLQLKESRHNLERKVEERTWQLEQNIQELNRTKTSTLQMLETLEAAKRELENVNLELKEMDENKLKFIGIASHELKTPLTAVKANIGFILSEKGGKIPDYLKSYLFTIQRNTNRIQATMDHMLDLAGSNRAIFSSFQNLFCSPKWSGDILTK